MCGGAGFSSAASDHCALSVGLRAQPCAVGTEEIGFSTEEVSAAETSARYNGFTERKHGGNLWVRPWPTLVFEGVEFPRAKGRPPNASDPGTLAASSCAR